MDSKIEKYKFKAGLPIEFEIVDLANLYKKSKDALIKTHRTGFYHVIWFEEGNLTHMVDFIPVKIVPNTLLFLNKDTVHRFDSKVEFKGKGILFTEEFFSKTEQDSRYLRSTILFNDLFTISLLHLDGKTQVFNSLFQLMLLEASNQMDNYHPDILKNHLYTFLLLSERERINQNFIPIKSGSDLDLTMLFKELLDKRFQKEKSVGFYTEHIGATEKRLNQATTKVFGKSPKEIIDDRIILEAKRLLAHTTRSVKEIGYDLGFEDPTYFIKYFRKHNNSTPLEFRESLELD